MLNFFSNLLSEVAHIFGTTESLYSKTCVFGWWLVFFSKLYFSMVFPGHSLMDWGPWAIRGGPGSTREIAKSLNGPEQSDRSIIE